MLDFKCEVINGDEGRILSRLLYIPLHIHYYAFRPISLQLGVGGKRDIISRFRKKFKQIIIHSIIIHADNYTSCSHSVQPCYVMLAAQMASDNDHIILGLRELQMIKSNYLPWAEIRIRRHLTCR